MLQREVARIYCFGSLNDAASNSDGHRKRTGGLGGMTMSCKSVLYRYKIKGINLLFAYLGSTPLINMEEWRHSSTPS